MAIKRDDYHDFITKIDQKLGVDLQLYKETQMKRRLQTLKDKRGYQSFDSYYNALIRDRVLLEEFMDRVTINVTEFFRNPERWEVLQNKFIPALIQNKHRLSIWSAACSSGEEPYSLAMIMKEYFPSIQVHITATDLDQKILSAAKKGKFSESSLKSLPGHFRKKYFTEVDGTYVIDPSLKRNIEFKQHNLLADPYPKGFDLIVCRNVLIYFTEAAKKEIYLNFSKSLRNDGILFVGSTEQIFNPSQYNLELAETFFYCKKD